MEEILDTLRKTEILDRPFISREALKKIHIIFQGNMNCLEAVIYTAKALDPVDGLPRFVTVATQPAYKTASQPVKEAVDLIQFIVINRSTDAELSVSKLVHWSARFLDCDASNDQKAHVIKIIGTVVENCSGSNLDWESILTKLEKYLTRVQKIPPSFREALFLVFGKISAVHPDAADSKKEWFFRHIAKAMEEFRTAKKVSDILLEAGFNGLNGILVHFPPTDETKQIFYENMKEYAQLKLGRGQRNTVARSALKLFTAHSAHFSQRIFNDYLNWHDKLLPWIGFYQSYEHKQMGIAALGVFYKLMSKELSKNNSPLVFEYFRKYFGCSHENIYQVKNILIGVSAMAENYLKYSTKETLETIFKNLNDNSDPALLAIRFEALSKIDLALGDFSRTNQLTGMAVSLIENYPKIDKNFRKYCLTALENTFLVWLDHESNAIHDVVYQALLRSCAFPIPTDIEVLEDDELIGLKDYLPIWRRLLTINQRATSPSQSAAGKKLSKIFVECFFRVLFKLELDVNISHPRLVCSNDFIILVNLVELFEQVSTELTSFIGEIFVSCMNRSRKYPYVSGFYKILASCLALDDSIEDMAAFSEFLGICVKCIDSVTDDDLLLANLKLIFFSPAVALTGYVSHLRLILNTGIRMAHGFPELYKWIVAGLDRWHAGSLDLDEILIEILPQLSATLLNPSNAVNTMVAQKMFLMFIAQLEPDTKYVEDVKHTVPAADGLPLVYKLCLPDMKATLALNRLVPRIIDLSVCSADRGTRIAAAEILHAVALMTVARTRDVEQQSYALLRVVLQACLTLSCDTDQFIRTLFRQLIIQIVHYYARKQQDASRIVLEVLFDGVTDRIDSGLRQFGAECLEEFVTWAKREGNHEAVDYVLGITCDFTRHPDRAKWIGSVNAFNRIYPLIDFDTMKKYGHVFLDNFFNCLEICDKDSDAEIIENAVERIRELFFESDTETLTEIFVNGFKACQSGNPRVSRVSRKLIEDLYLSTAHYVKECGIQTDFRGDDLIARISYVNWLVLKGVMQKKHLPAVESNAAREMLRSFKNVAPKTPEHLKILLDFFLDNDQITEQDVNDFSDVFGTLGMRCKKQYQRFLTHLKATSNLAAFSYRLLVINENALLANVTNCVFLDDFIVFHRSGLINFNYSGDGIVAKIYETCVDESKTVDKPVLSRLKNLVEFAGERDLTARMVIELIANEQLMDRDKTKGQYFFDLFQKELSDFLANTPETSRIFAQTECGLRWMIAVLTHSTEPATIVLKISKDWNLWMKRTNSDLFSLLKTIESRCPCLLKDAVEVVQWFNQLPRQPKPDFNEICEFFVVFPALFNADFPIKVMEKNWLRLKGHLDENKNYVPIFEQILVTCKQTGNRELLQYFLKSVSESYSTILWARIQEELKLMNPDGDDQHCNTVYELVLGDHIGHAQIGFFNDVLMHLLRVRFCNQFFEESIGQLLDLLEKDLTERVKCDLARKCAAADLVAIFYDNTTLTDRQRIQNSLGEHELFKKIIQACKIGRVRSKSLEMLRKFNCACFGVLAAFARQLTNTEHIRLFLLRPEIWPYLVDNSVDFILPLKLTKSANFHRNPTERKNEKYVNSCTSTLFASTLCDDVRKFDFSHVTVTEPATDSSNAELQDDPLSKLEIVTKFVACVENVPRRCFEDFFKQSFQSGSFNETCVKLKLVIILNLKIDQEFQEIILNGITKILVCGMNFLVTDLLNFLIDQNTKYLVTGSVLFDIIQLIIDKPNCLRENDLREIFVTLKKTFEFWRESFGRNQMTHFLLTRITEKSLNFINLELASIFLANALFELDENCVLKLIVFLRGVCDSDAKHSNMAGEVYGLLLSKLSQIPAEFLTIKKDVIILYRVFKFYPEIGSNYVEFLMERAWQERTVLKEFALEMLLSHIRRLNNFGNVELETAFLSFASDILKSASQPAQELILEIIGIDCCRDYWRPLLPEIVKLSQNSSPKLRKLSCDILIKLYGTDSVKLPLLKRINDCDSKISASVLEFFLTLCPNGTKNRLNLIMSDFYAPETETDFLEYATRILLAAARSTPDFFQPVFDYPLTDCTFTDVDFNRKFISTFTPMFARSIVENYSQSNSKHARLSLCRAYRSGNYPDIQIKNSEFIQLLETLMAKDKQFCKSLFITIFTAIAGPENEDALDGNLRNFFENSTGNDLGCVAGFMEIALERRVKLPVEAIARLSRTTGLLSIGALLIESSMDATETRSEAKRRKTETPWLRLAEIYYDLKDTQALRGILLNHLSVNSNAKLALAREISYDFVAAAELYGQAVKDEILPDYLNFYNQSYLTCLASLSDWEKILECVNETCGNGEKLWTDFWCADVLLPWKLRAEMLVNRDNFVKYIDGFLNDNGKRKGLAKFGEEIAVACFLQSDIPKSISFIHNAFGHFLNQWSNSSQWDYALRKNYLKNLQIIAEISNVVDAFSATSRNAEIIKMCAQTRNQVPNVWSDLTVWDVRLRLRQHFANLIQDETFNQTLTDAFLVYSDVAVNQGNFTLSRRYLKLTQSRKLYESQTARWKAVRKLCLIAEIKQKNSDEKLKEFLKILDTDDDDYANLEILTEIIAECEKLGKFNWEFLPENRKNLKQCWKTNFERVIDGISVAERSKSYLKFAKILKDFTEFSEIGVAILKAMRYGGQEAREMFALILTRGDESPEILKESRLVPTWMFLMWKNQLVAYLSQKSVFVKEIVERITKDFPDAVRKVDKKFVDEIAQLMNPFMKMKYFFDQIEFALLEKVPDWTGIRAAFTEMMDIVNAPETENNRVIRRLKENVKAFCTITDARQLENALIDLRFDFKEPDNFYRPVKQLKHCSSWLSEFRSIRFGLHCLEIRTGVYDGFCEPRQDKRVFVAYFKPTVVVIRSLREPVKLTMVGTDAREYNFLIKFGEDLRQDERIQQTLSQIRRTLKRDDLVTYRVEPLTDVLGMIQWVDSCKTLTQLMAIGPDEMNQASLQHTKFLSDGTEMSILKCYRNAFLNKSFEDAAEAFKQRVACFKEDALRTGIWRLAQSPQEFFGFRRNFGQSLAALSVAHWVIGVGDRHLDNILVSVKTGRVVGIDFGMAFGFATQFLPLPEMVPFRLTPQMVRVLSPLRENGWLRLTMTETLETIRADPAVLLATLQVFVLEPCLDWVQQAKRLARQQGGTALHPQWYQLSKIKTVEEKLTGIHPVHCFEVDLKTGRAADLCLNRQLAVLNGVNSERGSLKNCRNLSAQDQVRCLIDLAMDPVVLCFTYVGWCPWL